ncbi:hypothetical protein [Aminipila terrae]|uniref:Uncharacterized protein n=1 Tax=Aminipila terrae TaxID=2697030 RepID=A0A6P1MDB9_9FIRM|nr:hypothetical protein [Aminipila terrae]QHI72679.1 hypothetical protein Ami3637_09960 [Aminipila terrae]
MIEKIDYALPIIIIFMAITIFVTGMFMFYKLFARFSDRTARKIEIVGYVVLTVVLIWELLFKNILMAEFYQSDSFFISQKLDDIYTLLIHPEIPEDTYRFYNLQQNEGVITQIVITDSIEFVLKLISTLAIAIGRIQELLITKKDGGKDNPKILQGQDCYQPIDENKADLSLNKEIKSNNTCSY